MIGETKGWKTLDQRVKKLWMVETVISSFVFPLILLIPDSLIRASRPLPVPFGAVPLAVFLVMLPFGVWMVGRRFDNCRYALREHDLVVASGVFWKTRRYIARPRIQHLDVTAGPIARSLGIEHVAIYVGGQLGPVAYIPGLGPAEVEALRRTLVRVETVAPPPAPPAT